MKKQNYYTVLGIPKGATPEEIRQSYRALAMRFHPDRNPENPNAAERFHEIVEAYEVLSDPMRRQQYDQLGALFRLDGRPPEKEDLSAFVSDTISRIFSRKKQQKGSDLHYEITISLEQVASGAHVPLTIVRECNCSSCGGIGAAPDGLETCPKCEGKGTLGGRFFRSSCDRCGGTGSIITKRCKRCGGTGRTDRQESLEINVPQGVQAGQTLRIISKGNEGTKAGMEGHLFIRVQLREHPHFSRRGCDVFCDVPIHWSEAVLGASILVPTLSGSSMIRIPKGTQSHKTFRLKEQGLPDAEGKKRGDIHYKVIVEVPQLDRDLEQFVSQLDQKLVQKPHTNVHSFRTSIHNKE